MTINDDIGVIQWWYENDATIMYQQLSIITIIINKDDDDHANNSHMLLWLSALVVAERVLLPTEPLGPPSPSRLSPAPLSLPGAPAGGSLIIIVNLDVCVALVRRTAFYYVVEQADLRIPAHSAQSRRNHRRAHQGEP